MIQLIVFFGYINHKNQTMSKSGITNNCFSVIRGATTSKGNTSTYIELAVKELIDELITRNNLKSENIFNIIFFIHLIKFIKSFI